jgi:hypothetical protein
VERLRELLSEADRHLSGIERDLESGKDLTGLDLYQRMEGAIEGVWGSARRYLAVVDGLEAEGDEDVVKAARHTGLLGDEEAKDAFDLLRGLKGSAATRELDRETADRYARFLRLWLERVRDTAAKAE